MVDVVIDSVLGKARELQERVMLDIIRVDQPDPVRVFNPVTGQHETTWSNVYLGRARVATTSPGNADVTSGVHEIIPQIMVTVPWNAPTFPKDARVEVTGSGTDNPLAGSTVWITDETTNHLPTARRYTARTVK